MPAPAPSPVPERVQGRFFSRLREHGRTFSLTPFDESSAEGRAQERHRRVALSAAAAALAKVLSVGTALISVPLTLHYLGAERFGMWMTISSLIALLAFADFGIANGVLSEVAGASGRDDATAVRGIVASGFFLLCGIAVAALLAFAVVYKWVPWATLFNVNGEQARSEAGPAIAVFVSCYAAAIPLGVAQRVQMGLQQGFAASLWQCAGSLCALAGVLLAIQWRAGLPWLVLALAGTPLLMALLNSLHFYGRSKPELRPSIDAVDAQAMRRVARAGALFFVLQLTVALAYTSDSLVIAQALGASAVASYAVPEKLFSLITLALAMVLAPLWPAYAEAASRGDHAWVRSTFKRSLFIALALAAVAALSLTLLAPAVLLAWVGAAVVAPTSLLVALASWKVVEAGGMVLAALLNGLRVMKLQVLCAIPTALSALALKVVLVPILGVSGAVWASVAAYLVFTALPVAVRVPGLLQSRSAAA